MDLSQAVATARSLAAQHPGATLPCPACAASVQAGNLDKHIGKVHAALQVGGASASVSLRGADRFMVRPAIALVIIWAVAVAGVFAMQIPLSDQLMLAIGAPFLLVFTLLLLAVFGVFKAELTLGPKQLQLRAGLGLVSRAMAVPSQIETGSLIASQDTSVTNLGDDTVARDKQVGRYLRLIGDGTAITVGAAKAAGLSKHWDGAGFRAAGKRRSCDIMLAREQLVALEYWLAAHGALRPKSP